MWLRRWTSVTPPVLYICLGLLLLFDTVFCESHNQKTTKSVVITADDEKLRDPEGYAAIAQLHRQMDDDNSGSIDRSESNDFIVADMQFGGSDRARRERAFHHDNDEQITVDDLWEAWFAAEERSWSTALVVRWLENSVKLPQYSNVFLERQVDGRQLPMMAVGNSSYLTTTLGVKNPVHRHKIQLKALDVVLFGFSVDQSSTMKDIALSILLVVLATVLILFKRHRSRSRSEMEQLSSKLTQLRSMESDFECAQQQFEEERKKRDTASEVAAEAETEKMATLRSKLIEAERLLESSCAAPLALQPLLRRTCELEMSYVGQQRLECISEMRDAIELIDKLRRKHSSIVSSIKLATGASVGTDQVDSKIFSLKARMEKISLAMSECQQRWVEIESLCGFPLLVQSNAEALFISSHASASGARLPRTPSACSSSFGRLVNSSGAATSSPISSGTSSSSGGTGIVASSSVPLGVCGSGSVSVSGIPSASVSVVRSSSALNGSLASSPYPTGGHHHHAGHTHVRYSHGSNPTDSAPPLRTLPHSLTEDLHMVAAYQWHNAAHHPTPLPVVGDTDILSNTVTPVKAFPSLPSEMLRRNGHSKSSLGSLDSNDDEKENGNGILPPRGSSPGRDPVAATLSHSSSTKRTMFHLFRKSKNSV